MPKTSSTIRVPINIHNDVMQTLRHYLGLASLFFNVDFPLPTICYAKKGSIAGTAHISDWAIKMNIEMLLIHQEPFIKQVIPHELAHLIAHHQYGKVAPHGKQWQAIMQEVFDCKPQRTHSFQIPKSAQSKRYLYLCDCQNHLLTAIRHNKIEKHQTQYFCKRCKAILKKTDSTQVF